MAHTKSTKDTYWNKRGEARYVVRLRKGSPADVALAIRINKYCMAKHSSGKSNGLLRLIESGLEKEGY